MRLAVSWEHDAVVDVYVSTLSPRTPIDGVSRNVTDRWLVKEPVTAGCVATLVCVLVTGTHLRQQ